MSNKNAEGILEYMYDNTHRKEPFMADLLFHIFPNENFIDLCLYQYGYEKCNPGHSFGPAARNHYLFHYILSGTGTLLADDTKGITQNYQIRSGQGFMIFPGQVTTYIADSNVPWEYLWVEFDGLRITEALSMTDFSKNKPVYHPHNKELRDKLADELMYISHHPKESPFHLIGHLYLFLDYLIQSAHSTQLLSNNKMSDYYIKEAINYIEQNFQNNITIEDVASVCGINRSYLGKIFKKNTGQSPQEFLMNYRMVKEAEANKAEDEKKRKDIETRNKAEQMINEIDKALAEQGDKIDANQKQQAEQLKTELKTALDNNDMTTLEAKMSELEQMAQQMASYAYQQQQANPNGGAGQTTSNNNDDNVVDADFEEKN